MRIYLTHIYLYTKTQQRERFAFLLEWKFCHSDNKEVEKLLKNKSTGWQVVYSQWVGSDILGWKLFYEK